MVVKTCTSTADVFMLQTHFFSVHQEICDSKLDWLKKCHADIKLCTFYLPFSFVHVAMGRNYYFL